MKHDARIMSFGDHLEELRLRLILALIVPIPMFIVCLAIGDHLLTFFTAPLISSLREAGEPATMLATSPIEPFAAYVKVAGVVSVVFSFPWVLYQLWLFISPGLHKVEKRFVHFLIPMSTVLTAAGLVFLYRVLLPLCLYFLVVFGAGLIHRDASTAPLPPGIVLPTIPVLDADPSNAPIGSYWINKQTQELRLRVSDTDTRGTALSRGSGVAQQYRLSEYIDLVFGLALAFGLAFQLPLVLLLLNWVGLLKRDLLEKNRKWALLAAVVVGALLPTQDPASLLMLTAVLYGLFEFGIVLIRLVPPRKLLNVDEPATDSTAITPYEEPAAEPTERKTFTAASQTIARQTDGDQGDE